MKEYKVMAHINSLNGEKAEITVLEKVGDNDYITIKGNHSVFMPENFRQRFYIHSAFQGASSKRMSKRVKPFML